MREQLRSKSDDRTPVVLNAVKRSADQTLNRKKPRNIPEPPAEEAASSGSPLQFFNGIGGFDKEGREYVIRLENGRMTPAPWVNVISNPDFGFMATEAGSGYTWCENSRENKLTPWSNDPVSDSPGEIFYLQEGSGEPWSVTPLPARDEEAYTVRHGFGYSEFEHESRGICQRLVQFVPVRGTVKISILSLKNNGAEDKDLGVAYYVTPVLGVNARDTSMHLITSLSAEGSLLVENPFNRDFPDRICFIDSSAEERSVTGDRKEFFGAGTLASHAPGDG
jgi:cellobiose phosphorylase